MIKGGGVKMFDIGTVFVLWVLATLILCGLLMIIGFTFAKVYEKISKFFAKFDENDEFFN